MKLQKDLKEFIALMNSHEVEYVIVGGHAVAYHGYPRFTGDLDFFVRPSLENAARIMAVLQSFGFTDLTGLEDTLTEPGKVIQFGRPPNRIDILTGISGITFDQAMDTSVATTLADVPIRIIGRDALIQNKTAAARPKDLADVDQIRRPADHKDT